MNGKKKMIAGIALILGIVCIAFLVAPIQAYINGMGSGDLLHRQERERIRTRDCDSDGVTIQTQERERLRRQTFECNGDCTQTQYRRRKRVNECATNQSCNCTMSFEHYRYQYRNLDKKEREAR